MVLPVPPNTWYSLYRKDLEKNLRIMAAPLPPNRWHAPLQARFRTRLTFGFKFRFSS